MATITITSLSNHNNYIDLRFTFNVTQSAANNTSTVTLTKIEVKDNAGYNGDFWAIGKVIVNGTTAVNMTYSGPVGSTLKLDANAWSTVNIGAVGGTSGTPITPITVTHNSDGTKSIPVTTEKFYIYRQLDDLARNHIDTTETMTLPTINKVYTNQISHWAGGFKHGEGNNSNKNALILKTVYFNANYGSSFVLDSTNAVAIPHGFNLLPTFGSSSISGTWGRYDFGTSVTQKAGSMSFEYTYLPDTYTITYNLNGGTNNSANPTSYTVLYGVTFAAPTRPGYKFVRWTINGNTVTGINPGANATFSSADDLYAQCAARTTGNVTVTAVWEPLVITNLLEHWAYGFINGEGTSGNGLTYKLGETNITANYNSSFTMDASRATTIPNGYSLGPIFYVIYADGSSNVFPVGTTVTQPASYLRMGYNYYPINYTITYNLNGGTNNSSNPTSYNVLYGVTFAAPTKPGYKFVGWTVNGSTVTGINPGANAVFSSASDLYSKCAARTTGNVTVTAVWEPLGLVYIDNGAGFEAYQVYIDNGQGWDQYAPHVDTGQDWEMGG